MMQLTCRIGHPTGVCIQASAFRSAGTTRHRSPNLLAALHKAAFRSLIRPSAAVTGFNISTVGSSFSSRRDSVESQITASKELRELRTQGWSRGIRTMSAGGEHAQVAVIGAGVSGLSCASALAKAGVSVAVFEQARGPGGRMSTRRETLETGEQLRFDHGAQYFSAKDLAVQALVQDWVAAGVAAPWTPRLGTWEAGKGFVPEEADSKVRYVGVPGMNAICQHLSSQPGVSARFGTAVTGLEWRDGRWLLTGKDGAALGTYAALVVTDKNLASPRFTALNAGLPPPLESAGVPELFARVAAVSSIPSFALMVAFKHPLTQLPFDGLHIRNHKTLVWAGRDSAKPGRLKEPGAPECWVLHSNGEYAKRRVEEGPAGKPSAEWLGEIAEDMVAGLREIVPDLPEPLFARAHRWGGGFPAVAIADAGEACLWDESKRVAACGDYCLGPRVESAILSGLAAANKVFATPNLLTSSKAHL